LYNLVVVTGPTASGKTSFAANLAIHIQGEIISADSRQVYRKMDIGTGKDLDDYIVEGNQVPYYLIDIREPGYKYNVFEYQKDFLEVFDGIKKRGNMPMLVGGTGMYIEAVLKGYQLINVPNNDQLRGQLQDKNQEELVALLKSLNPSLHNSTDLDHRKRTIRAIEIALYQQGHPEEVVDYPKINPIIFGVKYDREGRRRKISQRLKDRLHSGMVEEVGMLLKEVPAEDLIFYGLEYKFITLYLIGEISYGEMFSKLEVAIHQFAKRQMTWFRKMERDGIKIHWLDGYAPMEEKLERANKILERAATES